MADEKKFGFGVYAAQLYNRTTGEPLFDPVKVLGSCSVNVNTEMVDLMGGANPFLWASEHGAQSVEVTVSLREIKSLLLGAFMGETPTNTAASDTGTVKNFVNVKGASVLEASTGIATVAAKAGSESKLATTRYLIKAASTTNVDVYAYEDQERGNGGEAFAYQSGDLSLIVSGLTITASTPTEIPGTGLEMTGGSGVIGMTVGDTATVDSFSPHDGFFEIVYGSAFQQFNTYGLRLMSQRTEDGAVLFVDIFKAKPAGGLSLPFNEKGFVENEFSFKALYDEASGGVMKVTRTQVDVSLT